MPKTCCRCKQVRPPTRFWRDKSRADGLGSECRDCRRLPRVGRLTPPPRRTCRLCGAEKPIRQFPKTTRRRDGRETRCTTCKNSQRSPDAHARILAKTAARNRDARDAMKLRLVAACGGKCAHCGLAPSAEWPVACFDFHHTDSARKDLSFARSLPNITWGDRLMREAAACLLLCANCHRREHARRKG